MPARTVVLTALVASCVSSLVTLGVVLLLLPPVIRAAPDPQAAQPVVRAERFELVDPRGQVLAVLGKREADPSAPIPDPSSTALVFFDSAGEPGVQIVLGDNMVPAISLKSGHGRVAGLSGTVSPDGTPQDGMGLVMGSKPRQGIMVDQAAVILSLHSDSTSLQFLDGNGRARAGMG
jgi:hypothetical protein